MEKLYSDFMDEITADELYQGLLGYGLFSEKLPPIFQSEEFCDYSLNKNLQLSSKKPHEYIYYETIRNIGIPRQLGIPQPFAYQSLCYFLKEHWDNICEHFHNQTLGMSYKVSQIHIRKSKKSKALFEMNYPDWKYSSSPVLDIQMGMKYIVKADISTCFPSIYTHALSWALAGKDIAKSNKDNKNLWYNQIDFYCRNMKSGETKGLLIGPHTSNLLSEIILTTIDRKLWSKGWKYIRHIDDIECYLKTYEDCQRFIIELNDTLREFDLTLNFKKVKIERLPIKIGCDWIYELNVAGLIEPYGKVSYKTARAYLDLALSLMKVNDDNASVLNYAIKVLSGESFSKNAKNLCEKTILQWATIYPYLILLIDDFVFNAYDTNIEVIKDFSDIIFRESFDQNSFEGAIYALFFAIKYDFEINNIDIIKIRDKNQCLLSLLALIYCHKKRMIKEENILRDYAKDLLKDDTDFDRNWLFIYEALPSDNFSDNWKALKDAGVSFLKPDFKI